jgi:2,3-bisphosphoglycerate-dependent phosphoglycerate mutase
MRLLFIRHGQSANNALWDSTGANTGRSDDPALTETGRQQAALLAKYLSHSGNRFGITHLYTSLMIRSIETALAISDAIGLPVHSWEDLHESGGIYNDGEDGSPIGLPGKTRTDFVTTYPGLILPESLYEAGWWNRPYESIESVPARAKRFLDDLLAKHGSTEDVVAVVSHGNFYRYFLAAALQMPNPHAVWFLMHNTAVSRIDFPVDLDVNVLVHYQNRIDHLPADLIT